MKQAAVLLAVVACSHPAPAPAPTTGSASADHNGGQIHVFMIGALPAIALKDGGFEPKNDGTVLGLDHTTDEIAAVLTKAGAPGDHFEISIQPLLVKDGAKILLFDTGLGTANTERKGLLGTSLANAGIAPSAITDIFISHAHGDHIGGLVDASGALAFPNATIHMTSPEWQSMQGNDKLATVVAAITPKVAAFEPGAKLLPEVTAVDTRGHTPGHSSYDISSNGEHLFYTGDMVHSWVISIQQPTWNAAFDSDHAAANAMRADTLAKLAASHTRVYAVHFPFPGIGHVVGQPGQLHWEKE